MESKVEVKDILAARERIRQILPVTPLIRSHGLSDRAGCEVYLKLDNRLTTGSFKERGACNFLSQLPAEARTRGVCAASAGNHALALSFHAGRLGVSSTIVMPVGSPLVKVENCRKLGARVILEGRSFNEAYEIAQDLAQKKNLTFVPGFDHPWIIAGQGVSALEILEQQPDIDALIIPLGGGGLLAGCALAAKDKSRNIFLLGVESEWIRSQRAAAAAPQSSLPAVSLAEGIAIKFPGKITTSIIGEKVDGTYAVSEEQIAGAIVAMLETERIVVEGAGAAGVAALLAGALPKKTKKAAVIITGSNIDINVLSRLILRDMGKRERLMRVLVSVPDRPGSLNYVTGVIAKSGANILEVIHERLFTSAPGNVDISFIVEVSNAVHKAELLSQLEAAGLKSREIE